MLDWVSLAAQLERLVAHRLPATVAAAQESLPREFGLAEKLRLLEDQLTRLPEPEQLEKAMTEAGKAEAKVQDMERMAAVLEERRLLLIEQIKTLLMERDRFAGGSARLG